MLFSSLVGSSTVCFAARLFPVSRNIRASAARTGFCHVRKQYSPGQIIRIRRQIPQTSLHRQIISPMLIASLISLIVVHIDELVNFKAHGSSQAHKLSGLLWIKLWLPG